MRDVFKKQRGKCLHNECSTPQTECQEFMVAKDDSLNCAYCDHVARFHILVADTASSNLVLEMKEDEGCSSSSLSNPNADTENNLRTNIGVTKRKCSEKPVAENQDVSDTEENPPSDHSSERFSSKTCDNEELPKKVSNKKCSKRPRVEPNIDSAHSSGTSASSSSMKTISKLSYIPKTFSDLALSVLNAEQMSSSRLTRGRNQLSREILNYLEDEKLIQGSSPIRNKMDYKILGDQLSNLYGKFEWTSGLGQTGHICQGLMSCISRRRRSMRFKKNKSAKSLMNITELSPEEALVKLEALLSEENTPVSQIELLLKQSFSLRQEKHITNIPFYLYAKETFLCEISLRMGQSIQTLKQKLADLELKFKQITDEHMANLVNIEECLKPSGSKHGQFLTITEDFGSFEIVKRPGPCVLYNETENDVSVYSFHDEKFIHLRGRFDLHEACLAGFGSYYLVNRDYPSCYGQFLGLLEIVLKGSNTNNPFPEVLRTKKLRIFLKTLFPEKV